MTQLLNYLLNDTERLMIHKIRATEAAFSSAHGMCLTLRGMLQKYPLDNDIQMSHEIDSTLYHISHGLINALTMAQRSLSDLASIINPFSPMNNDLFAVKRLIRLSKDTIFQTFKHIMEELLWLVRVQHTHSNHSNPTAEEVTLHCKVLATITQITNVAITPMIQLMQSVGSVAQPESEKMVDMVDYLMTSRYNNTINNEEAVRQ